MSRLHVKTIAVAVLGVWMTGCATMISGTTQKIQVSSDPAGATVIAEPGGHQVVAPATLALRRKDGPYRLTFSLPGYEPYSVTLERGTNGWLWGNFILGGLIGIIVDSSNGAGTRLTPDKVHATLVKSGVDVGQLTGDTLVVFADDGALLGIVGLE